MKANPAPRKKAVPIVARFDFHPFDQNIDEDPQTKSIRSSYIQDCMDAIEDPKNNNSLSLTAEQGKEDGHGKEMEESKSLLKILNMMKDKGISISQDSMIDHKQTVSNDLLVRVPIDADPIRHQFKIAIDSFHLQSLKVTEINLSSKCSIKSRVIDVLEPMCPGTSYKLYTDDPCFGDECKTINDCMNQKSMDSNLIIIQHPSLGFSFMDSDESRNERECKIDSLIDCLPKQMLPGSYLMVMIRVEEPSGKEDLFSNHFDPVSLDEISSQMTESGLFVVSKKKIGPFHTILCKKVVESGTKPRIFEAETFSYDWVDNLKQVIYDKEMNENGTTLKPINNHPIWLVSKDCSDNGLSGFINCVRNEDPRFRGIVIMDLKATNHDEIVNQCIAYDLPITIFKDGNYGSILGSFLSDNAANVNNKSEDTSSRNVSYCLDVETKGDLSSLKYYEAKLNLNDPKTVIDVHYSALNFRDVLVASGRVPVNAYPCELRSPGTGDLGIGMEFSGTNSTGKRVMGFVASDAIATKIDVGPFTDFLFDVPDSMTLEEAATIPVVYSTVYYALIMRGKLFAEESILIHAGSGGVGQAAINVCLSMGCEIYTTVGTKEKREFIKQTFPQMKDDHIFDSRSVSFADDILRATNGRGVDVVLNSLSEEKLQAGLTCLAENGRFVEIGKYDIMANSSLGKYRNILNYDCFYISYL